MRLRQLARSLSTGTKFNSVDVHTHMYLPRYMDMLRSRSDVPKVIRAGGEDRLLILPGEDDNKSTSCGRPIGDEYYSIETKLEFMRRHEISSSVVSLANPWLDFLPAKESVPLSSHLNDDLQDICAHKASKVVADDGMSLYGFGVLPSADPGACVKELHRIAQLDHIRGVIMGTDGIGKGLDDPALRPVFAAVEELGLTIFVHPHYGVGNELYGGYGHSLFLACGFTFETTAMIARLILSGRLDEFPDLKLLLAHGGGTLPFLAGRLDSCVSHEPEVASKLQHPPSHYLRRFYYDAIVYDKPALQCLVEFVGVDRIMFGTDNPFFPAPAGSEADGDEKVMWPSTEGNYRAMDWLSIEERRLILSGNAATILGIGAEEEATKQ